MKLIMKAKFLSLLSIVMLCYLTSCVAKQAPSATASNYNSAPPKKGRGKKVDKRSTVEKVVDGTIEDAQRKKAVKRAGHPALVNWPPKN